MTGLTLLVALAAAQSARPPEVAQVEQRTVAAQYTAYAEVEPIRTVTVSSVVAGAVSDLEVVPGSAVRAGEVLARITGPEQEAEIEQARTALASARAALRLAITTAAGIEKTYPDLSTRQQVDDAKAAVEEARAAVRAAEAYLANQQRGHTAVAPSDGTVLATLVANGDRVATGTPLVRLQPPGELWVRASYFGAASADLRPGMKGSFVPASGGETVPVEVRSVIAPLRPDGGRSVGCRPLGKATVYSGEMGTLRLSGAERTWAAVPTLALILDRGQWWVLVQGAKGLERQRVEIGSAADGWTLVRSGLAPGQQVVVTDAYLIFHRDFNTRYQPPD